jgi:hypothetical protein
MTFYIRLAFTSGLALRIKGAAYFTKSQLSETDNKVHKALNIQRDEGRLVHYYLQPTKTLGYGRTMNSTKLAALGRAYPMDMRHHDAGDTILGVTDW